MQTTLGASTVPGLTVRQIIGVGTGNIYNLARMDELLTGIRAMRAETTRIARTINYLAGGSSEGRYAPNVNFPLLQMESANPFELGMFGDYTLSALNTIPLELAVDSPALVFTSAGETPWLGQPGTIHDGVDAAQSGVTSNSQESWFQTTMIGSGSLSFWWKVSSETGFDYLEFYIDGVLQPGRISGNVDWVQKTYPLAGGSHTLRWRYVKDGTLAVGSDAGWVDQVVWTPGGGFDYPTWRAANFTAGEVANPLISGPDADPNNDGMTNILKFAFGLLPKSGSSLQLPAWQRVGGNYVASFAEPTGIIGVTYGARWSPTMAPGSWISVPDTGSGGVHTFSIPTTGNPKMFVRFTVTRP